MFVGKNTASKKEVGSSRISVEVKKPTGVKIKTEKKAKEMKVIFNLISLLFSNIFLNTSNTQMLSTAFRDGKGPAVLRLLQRGGSKYLSH
jgi:hypothetical protein